MKASETHDDLGAFPRLILDPCHLYPRLVRADDKHMVGTFAASFVSDHRPTRKPETKKNTNKTMGVGPSTGSWTPRGGSERVRALRRHQAVRFRNKIKCATTALDGQLYIVEDFLSPQRASLAFEAIDSDAFPWELEPVVYGKRVPQHSHHYKRYEGLTAFQDGFQNPGYVELGRICQKIEAEFGIKIYDVYCNRFQDPVHHNGWHKDKFGRHVMVLTLGSQRRVQFRHNKTRSIETIKPKSGDMYFMPLPVNYSHKHQVCPADENEDSGTRISLVFFFKAPKNVSEFKIKLHHQVREFFA